LARPGEIRGRKAVAVKRMITAILLAGVAPAASGQGCNPADLAEPYGTLDLADVGAFTAAFGDGFIPLGEHVAPVTSYRSYRYEDCDEWPPYDCNDPVFVETSELGHFAGPGHQSTVGDTGVTAALNSSAFSPSSHATGLEFEFEVTETVMLSVDADLTHADVGVFLYFGFERLTGGSETIFSYSDQTIPGWDITHIEESFLLSPGRYRIVERTGADMGTASIDSALLLTSGEFCLVDLAEPYGVLDLADIVAFVEAFMAGCP
jgi:hypothetical protein